MSDRVKKIWNGITTSFVAVLVILALLLLGGRLVGLQMYTVLSGSMEPEYPVGSLIYVRSVDPGELKPGDVITYRQNGTLVTHRILEVTSEGRFRTKGDANNTADASPVAAEQVLGSPVFSIPGLGYVAQFLKRPSAAISLVGLAVALTLIPELFGGRKKEE